MGKEIVFLLKALFFGLGAIVLIPKEQYKKYFIYGLLFGGIGDFLVVFVFTRLFHWIQYKNMGAFNFYKMISFWTPIAWMFVFMYFLYALPERKLYLYFYVAAFGLFGYAVGIVLENFGLYEYLGFYRYFAPVFITSWFAAAAWVYIRTEGMEIR
ncbi:MAG: hypothetical protein ACM3WV_07805 [Bacillota bacterium]